MTDLRAVAAQRTAPPPLWIDDAPGQAVGTHAAWAPLWGLAVAGLLCAALVALLLWRLRVSRRRSRAESAIDADRAFRRLSRAAGLSRKARQELEHKAEAQGLHPLALLVCPEAAARRGSAAQPSSARPSRALNPQRAG